MFTAEAETAVRSARASEIRVRCSSIVRIATLDTTPRKSTRIAIFAAVIVGVVDVVDVEPVVVVFGISPHTTAISDLDFDDDNDDDDVPSLSSLSIVFASTAVRFDNALHKNECVLCVPY